MRRWTYLLLIFYLTCFGTFNPIHSRDSKETKSKNEGHRAAKVFSLFNIVTFRNDGCVAQQGTTTSGGTRNGTCYTASECSAKSGVASGNCAAGFGVCCFFTISTSGTFSENCTYIRNPGFPSTTSDAATITYTVNKAASGVCDLRLDLEIFDLRGPTAADNSGTTDDCPDSMVVTTSSGAFSPSICGVNTGEHFYVDIGNDDADTATVTFTFASASGDSRTWEIKATQIECHSLSRPPSGCFQWHTTATGRITTFNWYESTAASQLHLASQDYTVCVRRLQGFCCVQYQVCETGGFSLDGSSTVVDTSDTGITCTTDYIDIPGASGTCSQDPLGANFNTRYCGQRLAPVVSGSTNIPICDCTVPFTVYIVTDSGADTGIAGSTSVNRGVCLDYFQIPC